MSTSEAAIFITAANEIEPFRRRTHVGGAEKEAIFDPPISHSSHLLIEFGPIVFKRASQPGMACARSVLRRLPSFVLLIHVHRHRHAPR